MAGRLFNRPGTPSHEFPSTRQPDQPQNVGPQGGLGPKYLIIPGKRPGLYWYAEDEFVPQPVVVVDEDAWVNRPAGQFLPYVAPVIADGDDRIASIPVDEVYWLVNRHTGFVLGQPFISDEDVLPVTALAVGDDGGQVWTSSPDVNVPYVFLDDDAWVPAQTAFGLDEDYWQVNQYRPYATPLQAFIAEDDRVNSIQVDEDLPWIPQQTRPFGLASPVISDEDVWPTPTVPFGLDEDYWFVNNGIVYTVPLQAFLDDEVWPSGIVPDVTVGRPAGDGRSPHRGFDLKAWKKKQKPLRDLEDDIEALYKEITSPPLARQAEKVVKPFVPVKLRDDIKPSNVEWDKVVQSIRAIEKLHALYEQEIRDDDDDIEELIGLL